MWFALTAKRREINPLNQLPACLSRTKLWVFSSILAKSHGGWLRTCDLGMWSHWRGRVRNVTLRSSHTHTTLRPWLGTELLRQPYTLSYRHTFCYPYHSLLSRAWHLFPLQNCPLHPLRPRSNGYCPHLTGHIFSLYSAGVPGSMCGWLGRTWQRLWKMRPRVWFGGQLRKHHR